MSTAIVAGANGAIGRHVAAQLKTRGWTVGGIGHGPRAWDGGTPVDLWLSGDIDACGLDTLASGLGAPDLIINVAGGSSVAASLMDPLADFERTVTSAVRLTAWAAEKAPGTSIVHASSAAVYGDQHLEAVGEDAPASPVSPYGQHKLMVEQIARFWSERMGVRAAIVRLFSVYGAGLHKQLIYDLCGKLAKAPDSIRLSGLPDATRDWLWIEDAARLLIDAADLAGPTAPVINGGAGIARTVKEMAELMVAAWGTSTQVEFDGLRRPGDPLHLVACTSRLAKTGFTPRVDLAQGLSWVVAARRLEGVKG